MGRAPCCSKVGLHRGPWTANEDALLTKYVQANGEGNWRSVPKKAGLLRCGKSCRLRWMNYLRPDIKRGNIEPNEEDLIIRLHEQLGNKWSLIASLLPGRTDNEIKNYWNTHLSKKLKRLQKENNNTNVVAEPSNIQEPQQPPKTNKHSKIRNRKMRKSKIKMEDMTTKTERKIDVTPKVIRNFGNSGAVNVINDLDLDDKLVCGSSSLEGGDAAVAGGGLDFAWPGSTHTTVLIDENDYSLDFPHHSQTPTKDAMLEKIYQEYLQLLVTDQKPVQLDPFQESVWA